MLKPEIFKTIVKNAPLVSIDICLIFEGQLLLAMRNNQPLKGKWFTPGGRINKNETWKNALLRIVNVELGISNAVVDEFTFMGIYDHFYLNSVFNSEISTHYVNLPHFLNLTSRPKVTLDNQHADFKWFSLELLLSDESFHPYVKSYAELLLNK